MGYQFLHIEGYARVGSRQERIHHKTQKPYTVQRLSVDEVAAEAERAPSACPHVPDPKPPIRLHGCSPSEAVALAKKWAEGVRDTKGRKMRKDGLCLAAGVISLSNEQQEDWPRFKEAAVAWLRVQYGERLRSVVEHTDEAHPHLHFYAVPLPGERFDSLHPGRTAAAEAANSGQDKKAQRVDYMNAMRAWQDDFSRECAANFGLARIGPGRRRLSRSDWMREKAQAKALAYPQPEGLLITGEDVKKRVTKKGILSDSYETGEELAARLTELVIKQGEPLAAKAERSSFDSNQVTRLLKQKQEMAEQIQKREEQFQKTEKTLTQEVKELQSLFTPDELRVRREEKRQRLEAERKRIKEEDEQIQKLLLLAAENMASANPLLSLHEAKQRVRQLELQEDEVELLKWIKWEAPEADREPENDQDEPGLGL